MKNVSEGGDAGVFTALLAFHQAGIARKDYLMSEVLTEVAAGYIVNFGHTAAQDLERAEHWMKLPKKWNEYEHKVYLGVKVGVWGRL